MIMTQNELVTVSAWNRRQLYLAIYGKSLNEVLMMRRGLQVGLTKYAKKHKYDEVQAGIISICAQLESWCRKAFYAKRLPEVIRTDWTLCKKGKASARAIVAKEWEAMIREASY